jgi:hypothetical protein
VGLVLCLCLSSSPPDLNSGARVAISLIFCVVYVLVVDLLPMLSVSSSPPDLNSGARVVSVSLEFTPGFKQWGSCCTIICIYVLSSVL